MKNVAIIGSGVSGLILANLLKDKFNITVFEKSRGIGGRLSTRRQEDFCFDHGAQYFTIRSKEMLDFFKPFIDVGSIVPWKSRYVQVDDNNNFVQKSDEEIRYVGSPFMNSFLKNLVDITNIKFNTKIKEIKKTNKWTLIGQDENVFSDFDYLITTIPAPQAALLLPSNVSFYDKLKSIKMNPCFSLMLGFDKLIDFEFDSAHFMNSKLSWLAVNSSKPYRPKKFTMVAHTTSAYAKDNLLTNHSDIMKDLLNELIHKVSKDINLAIFKDLHLWRYANNADESNIGFFFDHYLNVYACGDWCYGGRVEGAFLSAYNLSKKLVSL